MRGSRLVATCAAVTAVLATVGAASASASPTSAPAPSVPATTDTVVPSGSITRNRRRRAVGGGGEGSRNGSRVRPLHARERHRQLPRSACQRRRDHRRRRPIREPGRLSDGCGPRSLPAIFQQGGPPAPSPATPPVGRRSCPAATASVPTAASSPSGNAAPTRPRWCSTSTAAVPVGPPRCPRSLVTASRRSTTGAFTTVRRPTEGSSTWPIRTTRSPTTPSCTCRTAPVTCISATPPVRTHRS